MERRERGHRSEQHPQRGDPGFSQRDRRGRGHDDRDDSRPPERDDHNMRPADRRHWRGHDYYDRDDEFERGRDYEPYGREREPATGGEHRRRFLRGDDEPHGRRGAMPPYEWPGREADRDDDRGSGPYVGRGPKGYRRSDERIHEDICERLTEHPSIDASDVEVTVSDGDVTLTGRVESRTVKHLTENMVETVSGVKEVHNQLRVMPAPNPADDRQEPRERRAMNRATSKTRKR